MDWYIWLKQYKTTTHHSGCFSKIIKFLVLYIGINILVSHLASFEFHYYYYYHFKGTSEDACISRVKVFWRSLNNARNKIQQDAGLKITAGQWKMSGQNGDLTNQNLHSPVMLTGHVMLRRSRCSFLNKQSNPQL